MANIDAIYDGVTVYPGALPNFMKETLEVVVADNPGLTGEEAVVLTLTRVSQLAELATKELKPEILA